VIVPPREPLRNGGGTLIEVLAGLTILGAAVVAALAVLGSKSQRNGAGNHKPPPRGREDGRD
jgi:hypothetical protein